MPGYFLVFVCVLVSLFNVLQAYYQQSHTLLIKVIIMTAGTETNHYFFPFVRNKTTRCPPSLRSWYKWFLVIVMSMSLSVSIRRLTNQKMMLCMYVSSEENGEAFNYISSIFEVESAFWFACNLHGSRLLLRIIGLLLVLVLTAASFMIEVGTN